MAKNILVENVFAHIYFEAYLNKYTFQAIFFVYLEIYFPFFGKMF